MSLNSIERECERFLEMVLPSGAPQVQRDEMTKAFFAGSHSMFCAMEEIGEPHVSESDGLIYLEARKAECEKFYRDLMLEYANRN